MNTASTALGAAQPVSLDLRPTGTLAGLLDDLAQAYPDRAAVTDAAGTLTFHELRAEALRLAKALSVEGVQPGEMIGVLMGNRTEWIASCFAAQYLGATVVAINTWYTARELAYVLAHAEIRVLMTVGTFLRSDYVEMLRSLRPWDTTFPSLRRVVVLDGAAGDGMTAWSDFITGGAEVPDSAIAAASALVRPDDIALVLYTSGSTAQPKGVRLAHWGLLKNCFDIGERQHLTENDIVLLPVSLFWGFGCSNGMMAAFTHASHIVLQEHFDAERAVALIERFGCTAIYGTGNMMGAILNLPHLADRVSTLRTGLTIGSPAFMRDVIDRLAPSICNIYGFTEGYGNSTVTDVTDPLEKRLQTTGQVLPGSELRIVDPVTEQTLPIGQAGEIRVRGCIMAGYHKDPAGTARAFDREGFFRTGDLGALDEEGFLQFRGRLKEIIRTGGMNVSPAEVEDVLRTHPSVDDAFVIGLPDPAREEVVAALVVLARGASFCAEELTAHSRGFLSGFKVPRQIKSVSIDALPLTTTRKIHRARLAELFK
jgi:fatty-acyl-CoA synthase